MSDRAKRSQTKDTKNTFGVESKVKHRGDFGRVFKRGKVAADGVLVMHAVKRQTAGRTRLGLSISKRVGSAPVRNRWKRLIREAFRTQQARLPQSMDLIVRPKRGAQADYQEIRRSVVRLANKLERKCSMPEKTQGAVSN